MKKIKVRIGDIFEKDSFLEDSKSLGIVSFVNERSVTIKFDDGIILHYPLELKIGVKGEAIEYKWNGSNVYLIARGTDDRIKKKKG